MHNNCNLIMNADSGYIFKSELPVRYTDAFIEDDWELPADYFIIGFLSYSCTWSVEQKPCWAPQSSRIYGLVLRSIQVQICSWTLEQTANKICGADDSRVMQKFITEAYNYNKNVAQLPKLLLADRYIKMKIVLHRSSGKNNVRMNK